MPSADESSTNDAMDIDDDPVETNDLRRRSPSPVRTRPPTRASVGLQAAAAKADDMTCDSETKEMPQETYSATNWNDVVGTESVRAVRKRKPRDDSGAVDALDPAATFCPTVGSWYKKYSGSALVVHHVDVENRIATCQWFHYTTTTSELLHRKDKKTRFGVKPLPTKLSFEELRSITLDPNWICTPCTNNEFAIYKKRRKHLGKKDKKRTRGRNRKPKVLELFAGAGGMSHGFRNAKFDSPWAVEKNNYAVATHRSNFPEILKHNGIVYSECVNEFLLKAKANCNGYPKPGEVDHIHASPPCQGVSDANRKKARNNDKGGGNEKGGKNDEANNYLSFSFIDAVLHFEPTTATYENVKGLLKHRGILDYIIGNLCCLGYQIRLTVLSSSDYGDPQFRERVIIFASKDDIRLPSKPAPTHGKGLMELQTVGDVLSVLDNEPPSRGKSGGVIGAMADGHNMLIVHNHSAPTTVPDEDDTNVRKLRANKPSPTIRTVNCFVHPWEDRFLSVREMACLQSFPVTHVFCGSEDQIRKQIGNAVPVRMATCIARSVAKSYGMP